LLKNSIGNYNTANGNKALANNTSGSYNTANGTGALYNNTTGNSNTAVGYSALNYNSTGSFNTANGNFALALNSNGSYNTANGIYALYNNTSGFNNTAIGYQAGSNETGSDKLYISNSGTNALIYGDFSTHQILLGVPNATGYTFKGSRTLNVVGGVLTDSIRVALAGDWADYVFEDDYQLKPLSEVEQFIKTHKHLPNIPSAKEIKNNGVNLVEMNTKLLEKTEELTLYIIEQNKKIEQQQKQIEELQRIITEKLK